MRGMYPTRSRFDRAKIRRESRYRKTISNTVKQVLSDIEKYKPIYQDLQIKEDPSKQSFQKLVELSDRTFNVSNRNYLMIKDTKDGSDLNEPCCSDNGQTGPTTSTKLHSEEFFHLTEDDLQFSSTNKKRFKTLDSCINYHIAEREDREVHLIGSTRRPRIQPRTKAPLSPITFGRLRTRHGDPKPKTIKILLDTGASGSIVHYSSVKKLRQKLNKTTEWGTAAGSFTTNKICKLQFTLPELHEKRLINWDFHVTRQSFNYDMIIGRDLLTELGLEFSFKKQTITWDTAEIPMKPRDCTPETSFYIQESLAVDEATDRIKQIIDAKYEPADLKQVVKDCKHLDSNQQKSLYGLLTKYKELFDGSLGTWNDKPYDVRLKADAKPYHARAYPVPRVYEATMKLEFDRLVQIGVLKKVNRSEWAAPTFIIPKKDGTDRFISDFRELNKRIRRVPYPIPKIQDLLMKLEGFQFATSLD